MCHWDNTGVPRAAVTVAAWLTGFGIDALAEIKPVARMLCPVRWVRTVCLANWRRPVVSHG